MSVAINVKPDKIAKNYGKTGALNLFTCGAGPALAAIFTNPMEVAKVRLQMLGDGKGSGLFGTLVNIAKKDGILAVQGGLAMSMTREFFKCALRLGLYNPILSVVHTDPSSKPKLTTKILTGATCGAISAFICNPLDLTKTRLQQTGSSVSAAVSTLYSEGGIAPFWKGTPISMVRSMIFTSVIVPTKTTLADIVKTNGYFCGDSYYELICRSAFCGFPAASLAVLCAQPVDTIRTRLYNQPVDPVTKIGLKYKGVFHCASRIVAEEGVLALYKGTVAHLARYAPHGTLCFVFIDTICQMFRDMEAKRLTRVWEDNINDSFKKIDIDKDGYLDLKEVSKAVQLSFDHPVLTLQDCTEIATKAFSGVSKIDGKIDNSEFLNLVNHIQDQVSAMIRRNAFNKIDLDKDGFLSRAEVKAALECIGHPKWELDLPLDTKATILIEKVDANSDGVIDFDEFSWYLAKVTGPRAKKELESQILQAFLKDTGAVA
mmetsp:Transcript_20372/g.30493  ORF Transcript_20372/g.30493 Transcript_20372/m.30493 type:complete len:488 (-) Transcript_20372:286-1749(-)